MSDTEIRILIERLRRALAEATDEDEISRLEREIARAEYWSEDRA